MTITNPIKSVAAGLAAVAVAVGAYAIGHTNSSSSAATPAAPSAQRFTPGATQSQSGQVPHSGTAPQGGVPQGAPQGGFGTPATGPDATKAKAAATARYPGRVERVMKLPDGSFEVHVITSNAEVHVAVSKAFKVTGTQQGGPGGAPPADAAPSGSTSAVPGTQS